MPPKKSPPSFQQIALDFTRALACRDYARAYTMTASDFRKHCSQKKLEADFEDLIPLDWGNPEPIEVGETMTAWPDKKPSDLGWAYLSLTGKKYSEALVLIITLENHAAKIRSVEFGRP
jgi:hypothetical protein